MIFYRAIQTDDGKWTVGCYVDAVWQGLVWGSWHATEQAALAAVVHFFLMEYREQCPLPRPKRTYIDKYRQQRPAPRTPEA